MNVRNHKIYTEVVWEWNESTQQLEQISEQSELYSGNLALASRTSCCWGGDPLNPGDMAATDGCDNTPSPSWEQLSCCSLSIWGMNITTDENYTTDSPVGGFVGFGACASNGVGGYTMIGDGLGAPPWYSQQNATALLWWEWHEGFNDINWETSFIPPDSAADLMDVCCFDDNIQSIEFHGQFGTWGGINQPFPLSLVDFCDSISGGCTASTEYPPGYWSANTPDGFPCQNDTQCGSGTCDCLGICGGSAVEDECGVCEGQGDLGCGCSYPAAIICCDEPVCCPGCDPQTCDEAAQAGVPDLVVEDECGVCGGDNTSCADCWGTPNGFSVEDDCGVCDGDGSDDQGCGCFEPGPSGCDQVCGSEALLDECGVCGGNGIPDGECDCDGNVDIGCGCGEAGPSGCDNACGSTAVVDECDVCGGDNSTCSDCAGVPNGDAALDDCGDCNGGNAADLGCGCDEPAPSGCDETCGSTLEDDACGVCGGDGSDDLGCGCGEPGPWAHSDCSSECGATTNWHTCYEDLDLDGLGNPNVSEEFCIEGPNNCPEGWVQNNEDDYDNCVGNWTWPDDCLECGGGCNNPCFNYMGCNNTCNTNQVEENDECGVCGGDNSSCLDECGVPNGGGVLDECGICDGPGILDGECDCDGNVNDCVGECGGTHWVNDCGECLAYDTTDDNGYDCINCVVGLYGSDCNGVCDGSYVTENCFEDNDGDGVGTTGTVFCVDPDATTSTNNSYCPAGYSTVSGDADDDCASNNHDECGFCDGYNTYEVCGNPFSWNEVDCTHMDCAGRCPGDDGYNYNTPGPGGINSAGACDSVEYGQDCDGNWCDTYNDIFYPPTEANPTGSTGGVCGESDECGTCNGLGRQPRTCYLDADNDGYYTISQEATLCPLDSGTPEYCASLGTGWSEPEAGDLELDTDGQTPLGESHGCTDENACNYDASATQENGTCEYRDGTDCCNSHGTTYDTGTCVCDGEDGEGDTPARYCGNTCDTVVDDCGVCGGGNSTMDDCNVCDGDAFPDPSTTLYPDSYYRDCYQISGTDDTAVTNGESDNGDWFVCPSTTSNSDFTFSEVFGTTNLYAIGSEPTSCTYYEGLTNSPQYDPGCADPSACNYIPGTEGCSGGAPGNELTDTGCCVYPRLYCKADGSTYPLELAFSDISRGNDECCDVTSDGAIATTLYFCDEYDSSTTGALLQDGTDPEDGPGVDSTGYTYNPNIFLTGTDGGGSTNNYLNDGTGAVLYDDNTYKLTPGEGGQGIDTDDVCGGWKTWGCPDPAAINYDDGGSLYNQDSAGQTINLQTEYPVTTCQYCDTNYEFWFEETYSGFGGANNVSAQKGVSDLVDVAESIYLDDNGSATTRGKCFLTADVDVLRNINNSTPQPTIANGSSMPFAMMAVGSQVWDINGRLQQFITSNADTNPVAVTSLSIGSIGGGAAGWSIGDLDALTYLDLSYNGITGPIPSEISKLTLASNIYLNNNQFNTITTDSAGITGGICTLVTSRGEVPGHLELGSAVPTYDTSDTWLYLNSNNICPMVATTLGVANYPPCLTGDNQSWVDSNLGMYIDNEANFTSAFNGVQDVSNCYQQLMGCTIETSNNYWPEALTEFSPSTCTFDPYLHFPYDIDTGEYGGAMTTIQMIQALHADIWGQQYNYYGSLDVTSTSHLYWDPDLQGGICNDGNCSDICAPGLSPELNPSTSEICSPSFTNDDFDGGDGINIYDGMWIVTNPDAQNIDISTTNCSPTVGDEDTCTADARPLDFIRRTLQEEMEGFHNARIVYFGTYFPQFGANISMQGLQYFEDFDVNGDGQLGVEDINYWNSIGRYDIVEYINDVNVGISPTDNWRGTGLTIPLENEPLWTEFWATDVESIIGYAKDFIHEDIPTGQYQCTDGGDSSICYTESYPCGIALPEILDMLNMACTPCGNFDSETNTGGGDCIILTKPTARLGHDKIIKSNLTSINYFTDETSPEINGGDIYTSSLSDTNKTYYYGVTDGDPDSSRSDTQFYVTWGHRLGSGSKTDNGNIYGPSQAIYKQYASALLASDQIEKGFLISSGSSVTLDNISGDVDDWIYILNFKQSRFKDQLQPGSWTLTLSGSHTAGGGKTIKLTDNSKVSINTIITDAGRKFNIISGSSGNVTDATNYTLIGGRYGEFYPDAGIMVFGEKLSHEFRGVTSPEVGKFNSINSGSNQLYPLTSSNSDAKNALRFVNTLRNVDGTTLTLYGEKETTHVTYACRIGNNEFNQTNNFSILSGSGRSPLSNERGIRNDFLTSITSSAFTSSGLPSSPVYGDSVNMTITDGGETVVWPGSNVSTMDGDPKTFITTVVLWNSHGVPLAIATLSKPIQKNFDREVVIKVKLSF